MNKILRSQSFLATLLLFTAQANSAESATFESLYSKGTSSVALSDMRGPTKSQVSSYGRNKCSGKKFCLIWYFDDPKKAKVGVERAKVGNWFDPIPGLIAIYSKNKKINEVICYDPSGTC